MADIKYLNDDGLLYVLMYLKGHYQAQEPGKGLSTNDLTDDLKNKILNAGTGTFTGNYDDLSGLPTLDGMLIKGALTKAALGIANTGDIPTSLSQLVNDLGFVDASDVNSLITAALAGQSTGFLQYKGDVATQGDLPAGASDGDLYYVTDEGDSYYWLAGGWHKLDFEVDLSDYIKSADLTPITNAEIDALIASL